MQRHGDRIKLCRGEFELRLIDYSQTLNTSVKLTVVSPRNFLSNLFSFVSESCFSFLSNLFSLSPEFCYFLLSNLFLSLTLLNRMSALGNNTV